MILSMEEKKPDLQPSSVVKLPAQLALQVSALPYEVRSKLLTEVLALKVSGASQIEIELVAEAAVAGHAKSLKPNRRRRRAADRRRRREQRRVR